MSGLAQGLVRERGGVHGMGVGVGVGGDMSRGGGVTVTVQPVLPRVVCPLHHGLFLGESTQLDSTQ